MNRFMESKYWLIHLKVGSILRKFVKDGARVGAKNKRISYLNPSLRIFDMAEA